MVMSDLPKMGYELASVSQTHHGWRVFANWRLPVLRQGILVLRQSILMPQAATVFINPTSVPIKTSSRGDVQPIEYSRPVTD